MSHVNVSNGYRHHVRCLSMKQTDEFQIKKTLNVEQGLMELAINLSYRLGKNRYSAYERTMYNIHAASAFIDVNLFRVL